jgi:hypothetical protein
MNPRIKQLPLFDPPPPVIDEASLGRNQLAVLQAIDTRGSVGVREAGRVVYRKRGYDPLRFLPEEITAAGVTVLASLRKRGLVVQRPGDRRWTRPELT